MLVLIKRQRYEIKKIKMHVKRKTREKSKVKGIGGAGSKQGVRKVKENEETGLLKRGPNRSGLSEPDRFGIAYK